MNADGVMFGTEAHHQLGDISRPNGAFFHAEREDGDNYYGAWLTGFGFINVRFPKPTVRPLTEAERDWLINHRLVIA